MLTDVAARAAHLAAPNAWIVIGGIPETSKHLAQLLARAATGRVLSLESLDVHACDAEIAAAARQGASTLRDTADLSRITQLIEQADGNGFATLGPRATRHALDQLQVRELYFTHRYMEDYTTDVDDAVYAALTQRASVEEVERDAAQQLDRHGGVGARLRYRAAGDYLE
jgi:hypothetical protein